MADGQCLLDALDRQGVPVPGFWRAAIAHVAREHFVPDRYWYEDGGVFRVLDRVEHPAEWQASVDGDYCVVTQVDGGRTPAVAGEVGRLATSSASQPSLVLAMLDALDLRGGERVLEIGTGTGYNAALLAARLGDENVVTVEVDAALAATARHNLERAGRCPLVVLGDGADGYPPGGPFDRVLATCAVDAVPSAWVAQTRPGGRVVTPHATAFSGDIGLLVLTVADDGSATGRYRGEAPFMWLRAQQPPWGSMADLAPHQDRGVSSVTRTDPARLCGPDSASFIGLRLPGIAWRHADDPEPTGEYTLWLYDGRGSWAAADVTPGEPEHHVEQFGLRRLWDEVEQAFLWWAGAGCPTRDRIGITVEADGTQTAWLDGPDHVIGSRPTD